MHKKMVNTTQVSREMVSTAISSVKYNCFKEFFCHFWLLLLKCQMNAKLRLKNNRRKTLFIAPSVSSLNWATCGFFIYLYGFLGIVCAHRCVNMFCQFILNSLFETRVQFTHVHGVV